MEEIINMSVSELIMGGIKKALDGLRNEMNSHNEVINKTNSEIQSMNYNLRELEAKTERLNEIMAALQMYVTPENVSFSSIDLTHREQEVFLVVYSENNSISSKDIGMKLGFTDEMVNRYIYNIISKGVPLLRKYKDGELTVNLDTKFKDLQMTENVLKIDEPIYNQLLMEKII